MNFGFSIKDGTGRQVAKRQPPTPVAFGPMGSLNCGRGFPNFADRSTIIDSLVDGTLVVEVHMKPHEPIKATLPQFIPENPFLQTYVNQKGIQLLQLKLQMYPQICLGTFCTTFTEE